MTVPSVRIARLLARRVWDSRGRPTVEAEVHLDNGRYGRAIAPAGASTGRGEAVDLRDGGPACGGRDVSTAVANVTRVIAPALAGMDVTDQAAIDGRLLELDGTPTKRRLGGNATIAVSMAALHASAAATGQPVWRALRGAAGRDPIPLPLPEIQIFGGGAHAARRVDIQDVMVVPVGAASFAQALEWTSDVYHAAGARMSALGRRQGVADEGGFWPVFDTNEEALDVVVRAITDAGRTPGDEVAIALDLAATTFHRDGRYHLALEGGDLDRDAWIDRLLTWIDRYPIVSVEDPVTEDDTDGMQRVTAAVGDRVHVVGDDYLVTRADRVARAAADRACTALLVKPNQVGTVTETRAAFDAACQAGLATIVSARSGDTEDVTIAHLAVGWGADQIKVGAFARSERMAKWNELLRIEEALGETATLAAWRRPGRPSPQAHRPRRPGVRPSRSTFCHRPRPRR